ncbi:MAG: DUF4062 domain-containing protein [Oscillibacter sp.]|nr:DUF4062 domain-containing protein [Oscillibacter sp.]
MGVGLTDMRTPFRGAAQGYTRKRRSANTFQIVPHQKIRVFISSICGQPKYDAIREELRTAIETTSLASVYVFEGEGASTLPAGEHYIRALEDSDVCIFLIDNLDGISLGVQAEIDIVQKQGIKALYYFCDENSSEKTALEQSLMGAHNAKSKTVHTFNDLSKDSASALINDIIAIYHYYCKGKIVLKQEDEHEEFQCVNITDIERLQHPTVPKTILKNIDKCKDYILKFTTGQSYPRFPDEVEKSNEIDEWCAQFLPVLFEGRSIKHFNTGMFLETIKAQQTDEFYRIVQMRWQAVQDYFLGSIEKCIEHLDAALVCAKETNQPTWVIKDILIDLRNQHQILNTINNCFSESDAQKELTNSNEEVYYPALDRINDSLHEKYIEGLFKEKTKSPYTVTFGSDLGQYSELLASAYIISMYNGSLTHLMLLYEKIRNFLFFLCCKYDNWNFRRDMLKLTIFEGNEKEVKGIQDSYPEILNMLSANDAASIMQFCENQPVKYKRVISQLLAFGTVGYYLDDNDFKKFETYILNEIKEWLNEPDSVLTIGQSIFQSLSGVAYRMSQDALAEICCTLIDKQYSRWFVDMFKFIAARVDLREMSTSSAAQLVEHIVQVFEDDKQRELIHLAPHFLYVLRKQSKNLTEKLDEKVSEFLPQYYNGDYKLETTDNEEQDIPVFLQHYVQRIKNCNDTQGKHGTYFERASRDIAIIRAILLSNENKYKNEIMDSIISVVADTLLVSKEGLGAKLDAISLLACIVIKYSDDYARNIHVFERIAAERGAIETTDFDLISSNVDSISLNICLQFLFSAMGIDTYADILELMPYIQNDVPTTITVTRVIAEYLETTDDVTLPTRIESIVLQNVLQWLCSDQLDIRRNATRILFALARNPENSTIVNHRLISLVDSDNVYIKNFIMRNIYKVDEITSQTREYIVSKCEHDACFVVRKVCKEVKEKYSLKHEMG